MRFFLDENVPSSVERTLRGRGHECHSIREYVPPGSPDPVVAAISEDAGAALISHDSDFKKIAPRIPEGQRPRFRRLSMVRMKCDKPRSAERLAVALPFIELEQRLRRMDKDPRLIVVVGKGTITIHR